MTCKNCGNVWEKTVFGRDEKGIVVSREIIRQKPINHLFSQEASCEGGCCGGATFYQCTACMIVGTERDFKDQPNADHG